MPRPSIAKTGNRIFDQIQRENRKTFVAMVPQFTISALEFDPDDLLVFLDESGDLVMNAQNPFFCIGAVSVIGKYYLQLCGEWNTIRRRVFRLGRNEPFHAATHLPQMSADAVAQVASFIGSLPARLHFGWQTPEMQSLVQNEEAAKNLTLAMSLGVVQSSICHFYPIALLHQRWIYEHADHLAWRFLSLQHTGEEWNDFPRPYGDLAFMRKGGDIVLGLEIADLTAHLAWQLNRDFLKLGSRYRPIWVAAFPHLAD